MNRSAETYHIFVSYAHPAEGVGRVRTLVKELRNAFENRTRNPLRIFFDVSSIRAADIWESRITGALESSSVLVAVINEAYYKSEWCRREWDYFTALERDPSARSDVRRIFPVYLDGVPSFDPGQAATKRWIEAVAARQHVDLTSGDAAARRRKIGRLVKDIVASLDELPESRGIPRAAPVEHLDAVTGSLNDRERFVGLLAEALAVTIVGQTNEGLESMLQEALDRKRQQTGSQEAFWSSLRIVFLSEHLLDWINDERAKGPVRDEAVERRRHAALEARRAVRQLLDRVPSSSWGLYESPYYLPFVGTLFEMPNSKIVQLLLRRPQRAPAEQIYMEFEDRPDSYFAGAFKDIVDFSTPDLGIIPVGTPGRKATFECTSWRYRHTVLHGDRGGESERTRWLPAVLAVTWAIRNHEAVPMLQLRTRNNSHREIDRVSHLSSYIYDRDVCPPGTSLDRLPSGFSLSRDEAAVAVRRRLERDAHIRLTAEPKPAGTRRYHSPRSMESMFFYLFTAELPDDIPSSYEDIRGFTVADLLAVRRNQALRNAISLCEIRAGGRQIPAGVAEIAALNLALHGATEIGDDLRQACTSGTAVDRVADRLMSLERSSTHYLFTDGHEISVRGLAGLQYREFFSTILPLYAEAGVEGAAATLAAVEQDDVRQQARERLTVLYGNGALMDLAPPEE